jgi:hypothetical protein
MKEENPAAPEVDRRNFNAMDYIAAEVENGQGFVVKKLTRVHFVSVD